MPNEKPESPQSNQDRIKSITDCIDLLETTNEALETKRAELAIDNDLFWRSPSIYDRSKDEWGNDY
jgi:hypothetical protein